MFKNLLLATSLLALEANAFFRLPCAGTLSYERVDPVDAQDVIGAHVHAVHGANKFSMTCKNDDLRKSECTTCAAPADKSAYWVPSLYWQMEDGKLQQLKNPGGMLVYYLQRPHNQKLEIFPPDFRMIAGDSRLREFPYPAWESNDPRYGGWTQEDWFNEPKKAAHGIGWNCLNYDQKAEDTLGRKNIPQKMACKSGLRAEIVFPSCWNGKDSDSPDHKSHVRYPNLVESGDVCPEGFEHRLPTLLFEVIWDINPYIESGFKGQLVLSTGDTTGYGYHGDFMNGWDQDILRQAIDTCTNDSGNIEDCHVLELQSVEAQQQCKKGIEIPEDVFGPLHELPGCNKITSSGYPAKGGCPGENGHTHGSKPAPVVPKPAVSAPKPGYVAPKPATPKVVKPAEYEAADAAEQKPAAPVKDTCSKAPVPSNGSVDAKDKYLVWVTETVYKTVAPGQAPPASSPAPAPSGSYAKRHAEKRHAHGHRH